MDTLSPRCAGIDVHEGNVVVWVRCCDRPGTVLEGVRTFSTMTNDLLALADWLASHGVTHAALESTGVYWKPVFNILAGSVGPGPVIDLTGLPEKAAEAVRTLVEALRQQASTQSPAPPSADEWRKQFDAYLREVAARAGRYPEGFVVDDSRETIYEGRGE
jgi:hypothetical protein